MSRWLCWKLRLLYYYWYSLIFYTHLFIHSFLFLAYLLIIIVLNFWIGFFSDMRYHSENKAFPFHLVHLCQFQSHRYVFDSLFIYSFIYLFIYFIIYLFYYLFIYLFIYLWVKENSNNGIFYAVLATYNLSKSSWK